MFGKLFLDKNSTSNSSANSSSPSSSEKQNFELNGQVGLDPTRYGDWEKGGRCTDF